MGSAARWSVIGYNRCNLWRRLAERQLGRRLFAGVFQEIAPLRLPGGINEWLIIDNCAR